MHSSLLHQKFLSAVFLLLSALFHLVCLHATHAEGTLWKEGMPRGMAIYDLAHDETSDLLWIASSEGLLCYDGAGYAHVDTPGMDEIHTIGLLRERGRVRTIFAGGKEGIADGDLSESPINDRRQLGLRMTKIDDGGLCGA